jgi:hypothetical protein
VTKHKILCPISRTACVECAIYRGRHFYLCYSAAYKGSSFDPLRGQEARDLQKPKDTDKTFGMPEKIDVGKQCINNFEDYAIEKEFAALKH